tara:strand:+ start:71 stop:439 length:369 start_codon:yes stop_codon:yes gene_type:complete
MDLDRLHIIDLSATGIIGIKPDERLNPQKVITNVTMWVDTSSAAVSDNITDAANYRTISKALIAHIENGKPMLLERLAQELADLILDTEPRIQEVEIRIEKPGALRHARSVGISIHRSRVSR